MRWVVAVVVFAWVCAGMFWAGHHWGERTSARDLARLQQHWPDLLNLPAQDRAAVVLSALHCRLALLDDAAPAAQVFACLRKGAAEVAERRESADVPQRIEALIRVAAQAGHG